jgi:hypothetical protein
MFGYQPDGSARLFELNEGGELPAGWSSDIGVIVDPAKRDGDSISASAGETLNRPVRVGVREAHELVTYADLQDAVSEDSDVLLYDENNVQVKKRGPGRPRKDPYADN